MITAEEFKSYQDKNNALKTEKSQLEGEIKSLGERKTQLVKKLKTDYGLTPEQLPAEIEKSEKELTAKFSEVKQKLDAVATGVVAPAVPGV